MIDLKYLQKNFDEASAKLVKKGVDAKTLENLKELFATLKAANAELERKKMLQS